MIKNKQILHNTCGKYSEQIAMYCFESETKIHSLPFVGNFCYFCKTGDTLGPRSSFDGAKVIQVHACKSSDPEYFPRIIKTFSETIGVSYRGGMCTEVKEFTPR